MGGGTAGRDSSLVTHLECGETGERHETGRLHGLSRAGKPLLVRYDLAAVGAAVSKDEIARRPPDMWRFRELLPMPDWQAVTSLGEAITPLIRLNRVEARLVAA